MKNKYNYLIFIIIIFVVLFVYHIGYNKGLTKHEIDDFNKVKVIDTTYNKIILDSIEHNIIKKDSVIVKLKNKVIYEMEEAINTNDSVAVEQFKTLAGAN